MLPDHRFGLVVRSSFPSKDILLNWLEFLKKKYNEEEKCGLGIFSAQKDLGGHT